MIAKCPKCQREKICVEECVTGYPGWHVAGSRVEYCGHCDEPPVIQLVSKEPGQNAYRLVRDKQQATTSTFLFTDRHSAAE